MNHSIYVQLYQSIVRSIDTAYVLVLMVYVRKTIIILLLYSLILRHRHTAPQVYYVTDILRHRTYYVT
jgi:hypothetical protein